MIGFLIFDVVVGLIQGVMVWRATGHVWLSVGIGVGTVLTFAFIQRTSILNNKDTF